MGSPIPSVIKLNHFSLNVSVYKLVPATARVKGKRAQSTTGTLYTLYSVRQHHGHVIINNIIQYGVNLLWIYMYYSQMETCFHK